MKPIDQWIYTSFRSGESGSGYQTYQKTEGIDTFEDDELAKVTRYSSDPRETGNRQAFGIRCLRADRWAVFKASHSKDEEGRGNYFVHALVGSLENFRHRPYLFHDATLSGASLFREPLRREEALGTVSRTKLEQIPPESIELKEGAFELITAHFHTHSQACLPLAARALDAQRPFPLLMIGEAVEAIRAFALLWEVCNEKTRGLLSCMTVCPALNKTEFIVTGWPEALGRPSSDYLNRFNGVCSWTANQAGPTLAPILIDELKWKELLPHVVLPPSRWPIQRLPQPRSESQILFHDFSPDFIESVIEILRSDNQSVAELSERLNLKLSSIKDINTLESALVHKMDRAPWGWYHWVIYRHQTGSLEKLSKSALTKFVLALSEHDILSAFATYSVTQRDSLQFLQASLEPLPQDLHAPFSQHVVTTLTEQGIAPPEFAKHASVWTGRVLGFVCAHPEYAEWKEYALSCLNTIQRDTDLSSKRKLKVAEGFMEATPPTQSSPLSLETACALLHLANDNPAFCDLICQEMDYRVDELAALIENGIDLLPLPQIDYRKWRNLSGIFVASQLFNSFLRNASWNKLIETKAWLFDIVAPPIRTVLLRQTISQIANGNNPTSLLETLRSSSKPHVTREIDYLSGQQTPAAEVNHPFGKGDTSPPSPAHTWIAPQQLTGTHTAMGAGDAQSDLEQHTSGAMLPEPTDLPGSPTPISDNAPTMVTTDRKEPASSGSGAIQASPGSATQIPLKPSESRPTNSSGRDTSNFGSTSRTPDNKPAEEPDHSKPPFLKPKADRKLVLGGVLVVGCMIIYFTLTSLGFLADDRGPSSHPQDPTNNPVTFRPPPDSGTSQNGPIKIKPPSASEQVRNLIKQGSLKRAREALVMQKAAGLHDSNLSEYSRLVREVDEGWNSVVSLKIENIWRELGRTAEIIRTSNGSETFESNCATFQKLRNELEQLLSEDSLKGDAWKAAHSFTQFFKTADSSIAESRVRFQGGSRGVPSHPSQPSQPSITDVFGNPINELIVNFGGLSVPHGHGLSLAPSPVPMQQALRADTSPTPIPPNIANAEVSFVRLLTEKIIPLFEVGARPPDTREISVWISEYQVQKFHNFVGALIETKRCFDDKRETDALIRLSSLKAAAEKSPTFLPLFDQIEHKIRDGLNPVPPTPPQGPVVSDITGLWDFIKQGKADWKIQAKNASVSSQLLTVLEHAQTLWLGLQSGELSEVIAQETSWDSAVGGIKISNEKRLAQKIMQDIDQLKKGQIEVVQKVLFEQNFYKGKADGEWGDKTRAAVDSARMEWRMEKKGGVDKEFMEKIRPFSQTPLPSGVITQ